MLIKLQVNATEVNNNIQTIKDIHNIQKEIEFLRGKKSTSENEEQRKNLLLRLRTLLGNQKPKNIQKLYSEYPKELTPNKILEDLAQLGFKILIWEKGSSINRKKPSRVEFNNYFLRSKYAPTKIIHILKSDFGSESHYDLLVLKQVDEISNQLLSKRKRLDKDNRFTPNKRHCDPDERKLVRRNTTSSLPPSNHSNFDSRNRKNSRGYFQKGTHLRDRYSKRDRY